MKPTKGRIIHTLQIAYRTAICPRENLSYNQFSLYCCPISSFCYIHNVEVCSGENMSYIQFSLYCCPITTCPISDPQCILLIWNQYLIQQTCYQPSQESLSGGHCLHLRCHQPPLQSSNIPRRRIGPHRSEHTGRYKHEYSLYLNEGQIFIIFI